jgi:predicted PurR-regulated permease PerM
MSPPSNSSSATTTALWILATVAVLFFLRAAKTLLIPVVLAALVSAALAPIVIWLERRRVPTLAGAALVMLVILGAVVGGAYTLRDDARTFVDSLPETVERARDAILSPLGSSGKGIQDATRGAKAEGGEQGRGSSEPAPGSGGPATGSLAERGISALFSLAGHLVVIFFLTYFLLISRDLVRDRLVEIAGTDAERRRTTSAIIDDINTQIQRYLLVLLLTGLVVGVATWLVLAWIGVQHAAFWGILAGVFNSIPYFGPVIVSGGLFVVGIVQGGGITQALQMAGATILITSLEGWLLTPALMGKAERMSALAIFLGLLLWTWLWGPWGTVLAVPMLVVIKAFGDHVDGLRPVGRLLAP